MVMPFISTRFLETPPVPTPSRVRLDESLMVFGTASGGNSSLLELNTPYLFRTAPTRDNMLGGQAATDARDNNDWSGIYHEAQTRTITSTLDSVVRRIFALDDIDVIVVNVGTTGGAPPTPTQWTAAIAGARRVETLLNRRPGAIIFPGFENTRAASTPWAVNPAGVSTAVPHMTQLNELADYFDATLVSGGASSLTRAQADTWAETNRTDEGPAVWPAVGATPTSAQSLAIFYVLSMLEIEQAGGGRGTPLNFMPAKGVTQLQPAISSCLLYTSPSPRD